ncbi:glycoside hydrolase family 2 [Cyanobacteria bacterium FACHB-502]|nr:glycoside hydrolase family 2 [Cyanobacteria bacterium FACHB-502]MBD2023704.1 glycoside hydrolase family 2 [Leptolyngbya sp. FACHB-711]
MQLLGRDLENQHPSGSVPISSMFRQLETGYPRPQLQRSNWINLNGTWRFAFDDTGQWHKPEDVTEWTHAIEVPFAPEAPQSGIGDTGFHPNCWYEREFAVVIQEHCDIPEQGSDQNHQPACLTLRPGGRVLLHLGAVDYYTRVWVNGHYMGEHEGGHTPFSFDITAVLNPGEIQRVTVWAQDDPHELAKPRGKQDWLLDAHSIWYPRTSGIWQTVWLESLPETYVKQLRWTPHFERWEIGFEAFLAGTIQENLQLKVRLTVDNRLLVNDIYEVINSEVHRRIALSDPGIDDYRNALLWSPEKPTLIDAQVQLWHNGEMIDEVKSYTAMRTVGIQRDRFMLNGHPYYLRLVLDQGYWTETLMTPPSDEALRRDIELTKRMGFNGVRKHQKIEDPRFLYWADVMGLLVWEEMPSAYRFTQKAVERITKEWIEVIERDSSHPCIVAWVPINESWGVPNLTENAAHRYYVQALYYLTKTLDPTRPVIGNDGWESATTDILAIHDYDNQPQRLANRYGSDVKLSDLFQNQRPGGRILTLDGYPHQGQPIMLTEFGGIAYTRPEESAHTWGYARSQDASELQVQYTALLSAVNRTEMFAGFCYTQLTDTFQEANGLLYTDRTPKFPLEAIAAATLAREELPVAGMISSNSDGYGGTPSWQDPNQVQQAPHCSGHPGQPW